MVFFGRNKVTAGLDIGSGLIKLVVIDHSKAQPEIVQVVTSPLVPDAIVEGEIMDPVLVADTIRSLVQSVGLKGKRIAAAVGGHDVIVKRIQMDRMSTEDAREVIRWEAEQHVPFDMENVQLDFQILDPDGDGPQMSVLLVAAKKELIDNRLNLLADAGLAPSVMDVDAFALQNAFERSHGGPMDGIVALVNVGHETTNLNLLQDGVPVMVRDVPFGSRKIREALQRDRGLSADEAESILQGLGEGTDMGSVLTEKIEELAVGIERAAAFLVAQSGGTIARVCVCGGGARVPGLVEALGDRLGIRTEVANPLNGITVRPEAAALEPIDTIAPMLMLPVGLALRNA
jgi:type IV pilus assembly protein PilM